MNSQPTWLNVVLAAAFIFSNVGAVRLASAAATRELAPLPIKLPLPTLQPTPSELPEGPMIEKISDKPRPAFMAPKGARNVALGKKVTCSVEKLYSGTLPQITDGKKDAYDDQVVEFRKGTQWVQIDLEKECPVYAIVLWHDHRLLQVFHDVVVQAADDPEFLTNVRTLFNNDVDNTSGLGIGTDKEYFETAEGKLVDIKGQKARYLRFYSKGSSRSAYNVYQELEVYAVPE